MTDERIRIGEAITIELLHGTVGLIRCLVDPTQSPGDVEWSCAFEIDEHNRCTIKILSGRRAPTHNERRQLVTYFKSQGYHGGWSRRKNGKPKKEVTVK